MLIMTMLSLMVLGTVGKVGEFSFQTMMEMSFTGSLLVNPGTLLSML